MNSLSLRFVKFALTSILRGSCGDSPVAHISLRFHPVPAGQDALAKEGLLRNITPYGVMSAWTNSRPS